MSSPQDRLLAQGKANLVKTTFSSSWPFDASAADLIAKSLGQEASSHFAHTTAVSRVKQFVVVADAKTTLLVLSVTFPSSTEEDVYLASASDTIGQSVPVKFTSSLTSKFTSLIRKSQAPLFGYPPALAVDPSDIPAPNEPNDAANETRLNFRAVFGDHAPEDRDFEPMVVALPRIFPVTPGYDLRQVAHLPVSEALKLGFDQSYPQFHVWLMSARWLLRNNQGRSVTEHEHLFDTAKLMEGSPDFPSDLVVRHLILPLENLDFLSADWKAVNTAVTTASEEAWIRIGLQSDDTPTLPPGGPPGQPPVSEIALAIKEVGKLNESSATKESRDRATNTKQLLQLLFCKVHKDPHSDTVTLHAATLTKPAEVFLETSQATLAHTRLTRIVKEAKEANARTGKTIDSHAKSFDPNVVNLRFSVALQGGHFLMENPNFVTKSDLTSCISLVTFLPVDEAAKLRPQDPDLLYATEADLAESVKKADLFIRGKAFAPEHVMQAIAHFRLCFSAVVADIDDTFIMSILRAHFDTLDEPLAHKFIQTIPSQPLLTVHLLVQLQNIFGRLVRLADTTDYRAALAAQQPISAAGVLELQRVADQYRRDLMNDINMGQPNPNFNTPPNVARYLNTGPAPLFDVDRKRVTTPKSNPPASPEDTKRQRVGSTPPKLDPATIEKRKSSGIFLFPNTGRLPYPPAGITNTKGEKLCMFFCTQGRHCTNATCPRFHLARVDKLEPGQQKTLMAWVKDTPKLEFGPGHAPSGTP